MRHHASLMRHHALLQKNVRYSKKRALLMSPDGGLSGGSRVRRPVSEDPHRPERNYFVVNDVRVKSVYFETVLSTSFVA